ncbi:hypothetical protein [Branchiibius hedensis]|uniref:hypothetical protein n=1 Tax=Branchiibius hedensis TaxID=672460 RepID=UPI0011B1ED03|nr:hypothetical protein [Branchiibius hedensis]
MGTSPNDVVSSVATRIAVIRKLSALGRPLAEGAEKQAIRDAALDLYEADTSVAWIVLNAQLGEALAAPLVASWLAGQIPPDSTDPRSAGDAEVRELLAETFADAAVTDLSAREQSDLVLGEPVLSTDRADRWIQKLVDDVWSGEPQRTIPEVSRRELRDQLLRRFGT